MSAAWHLLLLLASAAPATEVVVQKGETLADVARRALGDERAAAELSALNALTGAPASGTALKLPGPERATALSAMAAAGQAVRQATANRQEASAKLAEARAHLAKAHYKEAAQAADAAWQLVSQSARGPTRFEISVQESGRTEVRSKSGKALRVDSEGAARSVYPGHTLKVEKGQPLPPPPPVELPLAGPRPLEPAEAQKFVQGATRAAVVLRWEPVPEAEGYEVQLTGPRNLWLKVPQPESKLPPLKAGKYRWTVKATGTKGGQNPPSAERTFEIIEDPLKLEVGKPRWE